MAKFFAWVLFLLSTAAFIASFVWQQKMEEFDHMRSVAASPLPEMLRFQQACAASQDD